MNRTRSILVMLAAVLLVGCERRDTRVTEPPRAASELAEKAAEGPPDDRRDGPPGGVGGGPDVYTMARNDVAQARCEHLQRCGAIGDGRSFDAVESCLAVARGEAARTLSEAACTPRTGAVLACARAWSRRACGAQLDVPPQACAREVLCGW